MLLPTASLARAQRCWQSADEKDGNQQGPAASCPENPSLLPRTKLASRTAPVRALNRIRVDRSMRSPCNPLEPPDGARFADHNPHGWGPWAMFDVRSFTGTSARRLFRTRTRTLSRAPHWPPNHPSPSIHPSQSDSDWRVLEIGVMMEGILSI